MVVAGSYTVTDLNNALTLFNENYDNGTVDNGNFGHLLYISVNGSYKDITCTMEKTMAQSELLFQEQMALSLICGVTVIQRRTQSLLQPET